MKRLEKLKEKAGDLMARCKDSKKRAKDILQSTWKLLYGLGPVSLVIGLTILMVIVKITGAIKEETNFIYLLVSLLALTLGFFNFFINKTKVNLELFNMRFEVYQNCATAISKIIESPNQRTPSAAILNLLVGQNLHKTKLLFDEKTVKFITGTYADYLELCRIQTTRAEQGMSEEKRSELAERESDIISGMGEKIKKMPTVFEKYISFKHIF
jgi:hypothetical protein